MQCALEWILSALLDIRTWKALLFGAGITSIFMATGMALVGLILVFFRLVTGVWQSPELEAFFGIETPYVQYHAAVSSVNGQSHYQPFTATPPKKKKRKKNKNPVPKEEPFRPIRGPRVQRRDGALSHVWKRVHLDECASSHELCSLLTIHGLEVTTTPEAGLLKASDREQLGHVVANRAIIVTHDADFLEFDEDGEVHAGIVHSPPHPIYYQEILRICLKMSTEVAN